MKKGILTSILLGMLLCSIAAVDPECVESTPQPTASSGVQRVAVAVKTQADGKTLEQQNVANRLLMENKPGAIQHLYILSAYSGQVLLYSTVKGKVTSSSKRLSPSQKTVYGDANECTGYYNPELLGDDGTYGSSIEYLFYWDVKGNYHQQYITGGMMVHISDQPMQFGRITMQVESIK